MFALLSANVCLAVLVVAVGQVRSQGDDTLQAAHSDVRPPVLALPPRSFVNGPTSSSVATGLHRYMFISAPTGTSVATEELELSGDGNEHEPDDKLYRNGHSYTRDGDTLDTERNRGAFNGHTRGLWEPRPADDRRRMPSNPALSEEVSGVGSQGPLSQQVTGAGAGQANGERLDSSVVSTDLISDPSEDSPPPALPPDSPDWSEELGLWRYQSEDWAVVGVPDRAHPALPAPTTPTAVLVVTSKDYSKKVLVQRDVAGLTDVTLRYTYFLSDGDSEDLPELKVYQVAGDTRQLLKNETVRGVWQHRDLPVPHLAAYTIQFEGWPKKEGSEIALYDVSTIGITVDRKQALDIDSDQMTLDSEQSNSTVSASTVAPVTSEGNNPVGNATQDFTIPVDGVSPLTENQTGVNTTEDIPEALQVSNSSTDVSADNAKNTREEVADGNLESDGHGKEETDEQHYEDSAGDLQNLRNESLSNEQIQGDTDLTLNSSITAQSSLTSSSNASQDINHITRVIDDGGSESLKEGMPFNDTATVDESDQQNNDTYTMSDTSVANETEDANSSTSIPDQQEDPPQTTPDLTADLSNTTEKTAPVIDTEADGDSMTSKENVADVAIKRKNIFTNSSEDIKDTSRNTVEPSQSVSSSGDVIEASGVSVSPPHFQQETLNSTLLSSPASNSTEAAVTVSSSSTSWQVFQVFLVLCVLGLLALGFLYWKRKRRQDDEIPVFTRHTDYHNPTFTMEDAANFMSRSSRNTYKTIE